MAVNSLKKQNRQNVLYLEYRTSNLEMETLKGNRKEGRRSDNRARVPTGIVTAATII